MSTPYRNEVEALRERKDSLEQELSGLRQQTQNLEMLRAREQELERELLSLAQRTTTPDCPVRVRRVRRITVALAFAGAGVMAYAATLMIRSNCETGKMVQRVEVIENCFGVPPPPPTVPIPLQEPAARIAAEPASNSRSNQR